MKIDSLLSISPLDGRYNSVNSELRYITSEYGLIKNRLFIEVEWFKHLANTSKIKELPNFSTLVVSLSECKPTTFFYSHNAFLKSFLKVFF